MVDIRFKVVSIGEIKEANMVCTTLYILYEPLKLKGEVIKWSPITQMIMSIMDGCRASD